MQNWFRNELSDYVNRNTKRRVWMRIVSVMACIVVFVTTYALILPAITLERPTVCGLEVHSHTEECYEKVTSVQSRMLTCSYETLGIHSHDHNCIGEALSPGCGLADYVIHEHNALCWDETGVLLCLLPERQTHVHTQEDCFQTVQTGHRHEDACWSREILCEEEHEHTATCYASTLTCTVEESDSHSHTDSCYEQNMVLSCGEEETEKTETLLICEKEEVLLHSHADACYEVYTDENGEEQKRLICEKTVLTEHVHNDDCFTVTEIPIDSDGLTCTQTEGHNHTALCYGQWKLICEEEVHTHTDTCYVTLTEEELAIIETVIQVIEAMPSSDEIDGKLEEFAELQDEDGETVYLEGVFLQVQQAYRMYSSLGETLQPYVTNRDKLLELEYIWSAAPLIYTASIPVYQINSYNNSTDTLLIHGGTVGENSGGAMDFAWWTAIVVEEGVDGALYVSQIYSSGTDQDKRSYRAETDNGFVLLVYAGNGYVLPQVGDPVLAGFSYHLNTGYAAQSFGNIEIGVVRKPEKDNTSQLSTVQGADTMDIIEINLYDYSTNINDPYNTDKKYPGFQQDNGTTSLTSTSTLGMGSFNFGNNITSNLDAGIGSLTNQGGNINNTASSYNGTEYGNANIPLEGTMHKLLVDDHPVLADGTSLAYLFNGASGYATKCNTANINGLFRYNAATGDYNFNSRDNHAQFNSETNTFTLYEQVITSNYMMYPFGNFLPFNDIVHQSTKASDIDRTYLQQIARSASFLYNQNNKSEFGTLNEQLTTFIALMDAQYGTSWTAYDAVNAYFNASGIPTAFDEESPAMAPGKPVMDYVYSIDYDEATNFYFGMEMKMRFRQPKSGLTGPSGQEPMKFYFTGDDDVWIYVDNVLFLDLSGIHRHVGGEIDFVEGKIRYYPLTVGTGDVTGAPYKEVTFEQAFREAYAEGSAELTQALNSLNSQGTFDNYSVHSFNFYYLERGAGSGVCRMNFNFPLMKPNTIGIEKQLTCDDSTIEALGNPDFTFQILDVDEKGTEDTGDDTKTDKSFFAQYDEGGSDWAYTLYDADGTLLQEVRVTERDADGTVKALKVFNAEGKLVREETEDMEGNPTITDYPQNGEVLTIDENGMLTLKAGQKAEFSGIPENWGRYYVRELLDEADYIQYGQITVSGAVTTPVQVEGTSYWGVESPIMDMGDGSPVFTIENRISAVKLGTLKITKKVESDGYTGTLPTNSYRFQVTLDGQPLPAGTQYHILNSRGEMAAAGVEVIIDSERSASYVEIAADQTAVIGNVLAGTQFEVTEASESSKGYIVTYQVDGEQITSGSAAGTIDLESMVSVAVTNKLSAVSLAIPVNKAFSAEDGGDHTYTFRLIEVADAQGSKAEEAAELSKTVTFDSETGAFRFDLGFASYEFTNLPEIRYYRITEETAQDSLPNTQAYIAQIKIDKAEGSDDITAELEKLWVNTGENGAFREYAQKTADFTNTLIGSLTMTKSVDGGATGKEFEFVISLDAGTSGVDIAQMTFPVSLQRADSAVQSMTMGTSATITMGDGDRLSVSGIPYGCTWTITETQAGGFRPSFTVNGGTVAAGGQSTGTIAVGDTLVAYTNTQTYILPETGGPGYAMVRTIGGIMTLTALVQLPKRKKRREEP